MLGISCSTCSEYNVEMVYVLTFVYELKWSALWCLVEGNFVLFVILSDINGIWIIHKMEVLGHITLNWKVITHLKYTFC